MNTMRPSFFLVPAVVVCAAVQFACDSQIGPDYAGEPLASIQGEVVIRDSEGVTAQDVAVLWHSTSAEQDCSGPGFACGYGAGASSEIDFECTNACSEPAECSVEALDTWQTCVAACGDVTADYEITVELCSDTVLGEMVSVTGEFPTSFTLDLFQPPPTEVMLAGEDGIAVALGFFIATDPDAGPITLQETPDSPPPAGIVGGSEGHMLIYAADPVPADSLWGQLLGGAYDPGYHVLQVIDGGKECGEFPDEPDECSYYIDDLMPTPDDLATPIELTLGSFEQIDWPAI